MRAPDGRNSKNNYRSMPGSPISKNLATREGLFPRSPFMANFRIVDQPPPGRQILAILGL
jgi:hypothetical protein